MSKGKPLTPQQEFEQVLSNAAVEIARLEQIRDDPGRPGSPAPVNKPANTPPQNTGARPPGDKDYLNEQIAKTKADTLKKIEEVGKKVDADRNQAMQHRALNTLYPPDKKDLNQIPKPQYPHDKDGKHMGDKEIDNAQERANALRSKKAAKDKDDKSDKDEISKSQDKMEAMRDKGGNTAQKKEVGPPAKKKPENSMSYQFKQPLVQGKDAAAPGRQSKTGSTGTRFSQKLSHNKPSPSPATKSDPGKSSPGGRD